MITNGDVDEIIKEWPNEWRNLLAELLPEGKTKRNYQCTKLMAKKTREVTIRVISHKMVEEMEMIMQVVVTLILMI